MPLTLEQAWTLVDTAHEHARGLGIRISVAVVDEGGFLVTMGRMDGAPPLSARIAEGKAAGAAIWHKNGDQLSAVSAASPAFVEAVAQLAAVPILPGLGSALIVDGEMVLGAAGASGASGEDDLACVDAGIRAAIAARA